MYGWKTDVMQLAGTVPTAFQYETRHTSAFYNLPKNTKKPMVKGVRAQFRKKSMTFMNLETKFSVIIVYLR